MKGFPSTILGTGYVYVYFERRDKLGLQLNLTLSSRTGRNAYDV